MKLATTKGDVIILVHRDWAPLGADHFYNLVKRGYYDNNSNLHVTVGAEPTRLLIQTYATDHDLDAREKPIRRYDFANIPGGVSNVESSSGCSTRPACAAAGSA